MATPADAELILKLYDLRREPLMRKARNFATVEFNPKTTEELLAVQRAAGTDNNALWRQAVTYWEMAASFCLRGALDTELFFDCNMEIIALYAKFHELYKQATGVEFMPQTAALIARSPAAGQRLENRKKAMAKSAADPLVKAEESFNKI